MPQTFSIAMCTYNGERHLQDQLDSIASQTRLPDELIICDDCSTDSSRAIIGEFAKTAKFRVDLKINERNFGSTKNFERAIGFCGGDFIALCDQDDVWNPEKLASLEGEFERASSAGLVFSDALIVDDETKAGGTTLWQKLPISAAELRQLQTPRAIDLLLTGSIITGATMAFRARFKSLLLPIPEDLALIHDGWIAVLLAAVSDVIPIAAPLMKYRHHSAQQVGARERRQPRSGIREAMLRETEFEELIKIAARVEERLSECAGEYHTEAAAERLADRLMHLRVREQLPPDRLSRLQTVVKELSAGRYHAYARGVSSAVKDVFRSRRQH
jgi:glycosyltransferase involved in cell wall biosynthesis